MFASALFFLFLKLHFTLGIPAIIVGHAVLNSAYSTLIIQARLIGLDPALEEAAADLGATPWRAFRRVTLITLMPAIIAAGLLAFTFSSRRRRDLVLPPGHGAVAAADRAARA